MPPETSSGADPRAAYCVDGSDEEGDCDDATTPLANVAIKRQDPLLVAKRSYERQRKDGSDSGYSSKAGTTDSQTSARRRMEDVKVHALLAERERQPYSSAQTRPEPARRSLSRSRENSTESQKPKPKIYYVHEKGLCQICDLYGKHIDLPKELSRTTQDMAAPPSRNAARPPNPKAAKDDDAIPPIMRRTSSNRAARPVTMYDASQFQYQVTQLPNVIQYSTPPMSTVGWATPNTPTLPYNPVTYIHTATMAPYVIENSYFEPKARQETGPARQERRSSFYGQPVVRQTRVDSSSRPLQRTTSNRDARPSTMTHKSDHSEDDDRAAMPPPPRPQPTVTLAHRPSMKKSATYNTPISSNPNRRSQHFEDDRDYTSASPARERGPEPSRPPSSYKGPADIISDPRPATRKSTSYTTPTHTTKVSSAPVSRKPSATTAEQHKVDNAEAYQQQRSSLTSNELTAEALQKYTQRRRSSRSEAGSSHKSHHTRSSSSAEKSKRSNSNIEMTIKGVNLSIPAGGIDEHAITISTKKDGEVSISLGGRDRDSSSRQSSSQRRIEKAPSVTSRTSRPSSQSKRSREREHDRERERERDVEDYEKERRGSAQSFDEGPNPWDR